MTERTLATLEASEAVENPPGIFRKTLSYNDKIMLCHFRMTAGASIPLHDHEAVQNGYVISGKVRFLSPEGEAFVATAGTSYVFGSHQRHGAEVLEEAEVIECFAPMRPEYGVE
jgi:quercetin dioxygenase-like cupin family protein